MSTATSRIDELLQQLRAAGTDQTAFSAVFGKLETGAIAKAEACLLAACYTGGRPSSYRTKKAAVAAIKSAFADRCYLASKRENNSGVAPW